MLKRAIEPLWLRFTLKSVRRPAAWVGRQLFNHLGYNTPNGAASQRFTDGVYYLLLSLIHI